MAADAQDGLAWSLVVPVKVLARAKSRLTGVGVADRSALVLAMAADTVAAGLAAAGVAAVLVVTDDPQVGQEAAGLGAIVLPDSPAAGLNEALAHGASYAARAHPGRGRAALAADLPAVRPAELTAALSAAAALGTAFVRDAAGTGTTLYAAAPGAGFTPRFGPGSAAAHAAGGAAEITGGDLDGLRRDVDTMADLRLAAELGLGPRSAAVVRCARWDR